MCLGLFGEHAAWDAQLARPDAAHTCLGLSGDGKECKDEVVWRPFLSPPGFLLGFRLPSSQVGATRCCDDGRLACCPGLLAELLSFGGEDTNSHDKALQRGIRPVPRTCCGPPSVGFALAFVARS